MSEKPEALEVAADLRARIARHPSSDTTRTLLICDDAARCLEEQHAEIERLREALKLALNSHGMMLMSDPPQSAWKVNRVEEKARAALRREETT